jgi:hypothetical protein
LDTVSAQTAPESSQDQALDKLVAQVRGQADPAHRVTIVTNVGNFAPYIIAFKPDAKLTMIPVFIPTKSNGSTRMA